MAKLRNCEMCGKPAREVCPDGYCRACHKSLSFDDCCDGTYAARILLGNGHPRKVVRELYPNARVGKGEVSHG